MNDYERGRRAKARAPSSSHPDAAIPGSGKLRPGKYTGHARAVATAGQNTTVFLFEDALSGAQHIELHDGINVSFDKQPCQLTVEMSDGYILFKENGKWTARNKHNEHLVSYFDTALATKAKLDALGIPKAMPHVARILHQGRGQDVRSFLLHFSKATEASSK